MQLKDCPLSQLLQNRQIFAIFDEEFSADSWLDVSALLASDATIEQLVNDGTVPEATMSRVINRLKEFK